MNSLRAFVKKECMEQIRSGRVIVLGTVFVLFGVMNPAVAKLTPWLFEVLADSLAQTGISVTNVSVTAMDSWVQFFKNIPMALIAFILLQSAVFTKEYESGTLVLSLTKGLSRKTVVIAKATLLIFLWTILYWLCFAITYGYNAYFWDNSVAQSLGFSLLCWWIFGLWVIGLIVFFSAVLQTNSGVLICTGAIIAGCYFIGLLPRLKKFLPTVLADGNSLIYGSKIPTDYMYSIIVTISLILISILASIPLFERKQI